MIAFGSSITQPEIYRDCAERGIHRVAEPDSEVFALPSVGPIFASYNAVLDRAAVCEELEALVLVHQDAEIVEPDFCAIVRRALADSNVGVVGCVGAVGVRSIAWWEGSVAQASFLHRYPEHGGGDLPAFSWDWAQAPPYARVGEVDTVDGFLLVLSPWVVRNIRFDESLGQLHGYDFDFCLQVREAGRRIVTANFSAIHSHSLIPFSDPESWVQAHIAIAEKWDGRIPGVGHEVGAWLQRARRAEAQRDAALLVDHANEHLLEAQLRELERALAGMRASISWRITRPLRQIKDVREGVRHAPELATVPLALKRRKGTMIAFGLAVPEPEPYERYARPGLRLAAEPNSKVLAFAPVGTLGRTYNLLLEAAAAHDDLEALVIVHVFTQLDDPAFCDKVRAALAHPEVAVAGCAGASDVRSIAWWEGRVSAGDVRLRYVEHGGGELTAFAWAERARPPQTVDSVDESLLVLSPWAVRNVRFDEGLRFGHGQELDYCLQVRAAGRLVTTFDTGVILHRSLELIEDFDAWIEGHMAVASQWEGRPPWTDVPGVELADERWRARRAEAQREAVRAVGYSRRLAMDAQVAVLQRMVDEAEGSLSWRVTRPLREINRLRRVQRERRARVKPKSRRRTL